VKVFRLSFAQCVRLSSENKYGIYPDAESKITARAFSLFQVTPVVDPWVIDKASLKHRAEEPSDEFEVTALVLNQSLPVACWVA
jgi:hypothetical protein